jgi:hypothetical protein
LRAKRLENLMGSRHISAGEAKWFFLPKKETDEGHDDKTYDDNREAKGNRSVGDDKSGISDKKPSC